MLLMSQNTYWTACAYRWDWAAWKEHLLTMDHLRSSVGLRGYAQVDPKVEYKREGMRMFDDMWKSLGDAVTNLIFRMEQLDENFVGSTWKESAAVHEAPPSVAFEMPGHPHSLRQELGELPRPDSIRLRIALVSQALRT